MTERTSTTSFASLRTGSTIRWAIASPRRPSPARQPMSTTTPTPSRCARGANGRLTSVAGVPYTWWDNGNLLSDGTYTYAYDHANRLTSATWGTLAYDFAYNGLGDRLRQTVARTPTNYTLDIAGGLTQVLSDSANAYLYGNGRIGEEQPGGWQYHLGDALGSVRQLVDAAWQGQGARAYEPFGSVLTSRGGGNP